MLNSLRWSLTQLTATQQRAEKAQLAATAKVTGRDERARAKKVRIVSVMGIRGDLGLELQVRNVAEL